MAGGPKQMPFCGAHLCGLLWLLLSVTMLHLSQTQDLLLAPAVGLLPMFCRSPRDCRCRGLPQGCAFFVSQDGLVRESGKQEWAWVPSESTQSIRSSTIRALFEANQSLFLPLFSFFSFSKSCYGSFYRLRFDLIVGHCLYEWGTYFFWAHLPAGSVDFVTDLTEILELKNDASLQWHIEKGHGMVLARNI